MFFLSDISNNAEFGFGLGRVAKAIEGGMLNTTRKATTEYKTLGALRNATKPKTGGFINNIKSKFAPKPKAFGEFNPLGVRTPKFGTISGKGLSPKPTFGQLKAPTVNKSIAATGSSTLQGSKKLINKVSTPKFGSSINPRSTKSFGNFNP